MYIPLYTVPYCPDPSSSIFLIEFGGQISSGFSSIHLGSIECNKLRSWHEVQEFIECVGDRAHVFSGFMFVGN